MNEIQSPAAITVAQRLRALARLYEQGQASELMERALDKILAHEADLCCKQLNELQKDLAEIEKRYGLRSDEFYRRYQAGQTDDRMDYVEWASLVQMRNNLQERSRLLSSEV